MPGIIGFTRSSNSRLTRPQAMSLLEHQQDLLCHDASYRRDDLFVNQQIAATRTSVGLINPIAQPSSVGDVKVWMEGEILNRSSLRGSTASEPHQSDAQLLAKLFINDRTLSFLDEIDGVFAAVIFDGRDSHLHFITDRHGLEFLYYSASDEGIRWSSEVKGFLADPDFCREIDEQSLRDFFEQGHMLGDRTWMDDAKLLPPASHWVWDLKNSAFVRQRTYWSWDRLTELPSGTNFTEVAEESARLFRNAVSLCDDRPAKRVGVLLSGGLDSRAILAAMKDRDEPITTVTFGLPRSDDQTIAANVAAVKNARHVRHPITDHDWLCGRESFTWWLDGHLDFQHMHYSQCAPNIRNHFDINLSGFLGDATIGGSYLGIAGQSETDRILTRGRRLIGTGLQQGRIFSHERVPFFQNDFLSLVMQVPGNVRRNSGFYFAMLRFLLPEDMQRIPWQSSGLTIRMPPPVHSLAKWGRRFAGKIRRTSGLRASKHHFCDYNRWFSCSLGRSLVARLLGTDNAMYLGLPQFEKRHELRSVSQQRIWSNRDIDLLGRGMTLEIWLRRMEDFSSGEHALAKRA